jgi:hypothetical protein
MRGLIGDMCIKTCLVNQNPAETCQVFGKNFSGQLYVLIFCSKDTANGLCTIFPLLELFSHFYSFLVGEKP